jgi:hypothetical protein
MKLFICIALLTYQAECSLAPKPLWDIEVKVSSACHRTLEGNEVTFFQEGDNHGVCKLGSDNRCTITTSVKPTSDGQVRMTYEIGGRKVGSMLVTTVGSTKAYADLSVRCD